MDKLFAAIALLALAGCASRPPVSTWIGKPETDLVSGYGAPNRLYQAPDGSMRVLTYDSSRVVGLSSGQQFTMSCRATFTVEAGVITHASREGNDC